MPEIKKGKVTFVASTQGIKLDNEEQYYNPVEKCKKYIDKTLIGKEVELTLSDENHAIFTFISKKVGTFIPKTAQGTSPVAGGNVNEGAFYGMCFNQACEQTRWERLHPTTEEVLAYGDHFDEVFEVIWNKAKAKRLEKLGY